MQGQGSIAVQQEQAVTLFGMLGTHSKCAGATLWLRDPFFNDRHGRKIVVSAESRSVAACAIKTVLFQLAHAAGRPTDLAETRWSYFDAKGSKHGPYPHSKVLGWAQRNSFKNDALRVEHAGLRCWVPLWFLPHAEALGAGQGAAEPREVDMVDWEETVRALNDERHEGGVLRAAPPGSNAPPLPEFPELSGSGDGAEAMDYELSVVPPDVAPDGARVMVVVDTNILLSHLTFTERTFERLAAGAPALEVQLLVPWVVLNELDTLKGSGREAQAQAARRALQRLRALTAARDTCVKGQTAAEHQRAVAAQRLPDVGARQLRNDDMILQTCLHAHRSFAAAFRSAGHRAAVFLLSNDRGLCVRSQVNGIKCFSARELPNSAEGLAAEVRPAQSADMEAVPLPLAPPASPVPVPGSPSIGSGGMLSAKPSGDFSSPAAVLAAAVPSAGRRSPRLQDTAATAPLALDGAHQQQALAAAAQAQAAAEVATLRIQLAQQQQHDQLAAGLRQLQLQAQHVQRQQQAEQARLAQQQAAASMAQHVAHANGCMHATGVDSEAAAAILANIQPGRPPTPEMAHIAAALQANAQQQQQQQAVAAAVAAAGMHRRPPPLPSLPPSVSQLDPSAAADELCLVVERCLAAGVKYFRQQDLGDMWVEVLGGAVKPPWDAAQVLKVIVSHNTSFWGVLSRGARALARDLELFVSHHLRRRGQGGRPPPQALAHAAACLQCLLREMAAAVDAPLGEGGAPDPAGVPDFISLGAARAALQEGVLEVERLCVGAEWWNG